MASIAGFFDIQPVSSQTPVTTPPAVHHKSTTAGLAPTEVELDEITWGKQYNGPSDSNSSSQTPATPKTPNELEMSRPPSPKLDNAVSPVQTWNNPPMNKWRVLCCCLIYFGNGMNDSAPGALIPYMEKHYNIGYSIVALIFIGNAAGFIGAAPFTDTILARVGRAKSLLFAELILLAGYIILVTTPPFPAVVVAFFLSGYGMATNLALNNVFCSNLHPSTIVLGAAHGSYGIGGIVAPIIATAMVSKGELWSRFYFISIGLRLCCMAVAAWSFWSYREDSPSTLLTTLERTASRQNAGQQEEVSKMKNLKEALKMKATIFGALFIFAYQGAEVSVSGWVISFLINYRNGDPAHVGYVTAGFWAGITLGRFVLTHATSKIGERVFVVGLVIGSMAFQLLVWFIPNVIGDAIAVSILGLLLGPVYPCAQTIFSKLMPRHIQTTAIGFIGSAGSSGGAIAPFTTGLLAQAVGTWVLHPICIAMYVVMLICWFVLPRVRKRTE